MFKTISVIAFGLCLSSPAYAGPPFVTDDPEPAEYKKWEVNYALTGTHTQTQSYSFLPQMDVNYGAAPGLQLHVQPQMSHLSTAEGARDYVLSGAEFGIKYRLSPESDNAEDWMISLYPLYEMPVGNANPGGNSPSMYLPVWLQTRRGAWTLYGGGGYWVNSGTGNKNAWAAGWTALYHFTDKLQFGGEIFSRTAMSTGGQGSTGFNLGGNFVLAKDYTLLFSTGRGLVNAATTNLGSVYLGLQVIY